MIMVRAYIIIMIAVVTPSALAVAQSDTLTAADKMELNHVRVTMADGSQREGYVTSYWSETGLFRGLNKAFKMSSTPDGSDEQRYTADEVSRVDFVVRTAEGIDESVVAEDVASPTTFKPHKMSRQFVHVEDSADIGVVYWWNGIDRQQMQLGSMQVSTIFGVKLRGDDVVVPFMTGNVVSLNALRIVYKKKDPGMVDYVDRRILKGGKRLWARLAQEPMLFLSIVSEYYQ